ncbi:relaxase/mobilization nuclease domain-containing protein [Gemmiger formicilis]|nr:relaxase/mobilization nuclease domain-containing protein [Gemmiger formicilis]MBM6717159.1 relaxase/mobilization nuclease domain-containing protein [Gemmiger formicilis]
MATTTLLQRHAGEGETIAEAIWDCLDYGKNPEKTESGKYISAYECDPATAADEFLLAKASYAAMTGREQKKANDVLCYQIRQSFYPGEITPKEANRIGYELAMRWTKGRHAFIVTTHTDRHHIHCHIYYNSTTLDCTRKFRNFWGSSFALRRLSDRLCLENGLSIVENPKPRSKGKYRNYGEWQKERKGPLSYQDRLRLAIDTALAERPADLDEFLGLMKRAGYEVKKVRGGGISFRLTGQGQERFTRLRASTLGDGYDLKDILAAIEGKEKRPGSPERKISLAVDIQAKLAAGKGPGYERWAKVFNIKQMAAALAYIQDNGLTDYEQLAQKATEATDHFHALSEQIKQTEQAMKTNAGLKTATVQYAKTRPVFEQYKAAKYSRKFLAEHEADIELYRAAQAEMRRLLGGAKLPKMDALKEEGRKLTAKKKRLYGEYQKARRDMQEIVTIKANIDTLLGYTEPGRKQEKER